VPTVIAAHRKALRKAYAEVSDEVLLAEYAEIWRRAEETGLKRPRRTANGIRRRAVREHQSRPQTTTSRLVRISERAKELGVHVNTLRAQIEKGQLEGKRLPNGELAVEAPRKPERWSLIPRSLGPDPRLYVERRMRDA
jgi:hypothetical protein